MSAMCLIPSTSKSSFVGLTVIPLYILSSMRCKVERRVKPMVLHAMWPGSEVPNVGSCYSSTSEVHAKGLKVERNI